jgi:hypothetical protein
MLRQQGNPLRYLRDLGRLSIQQRVDFREDLFNALPVARAADLIQVRDKFPRLAGQRRDLSMEVCEDFFDALPVARAADLVQIRDKFPRLAGQRRDLSPKFCHQAIRRIGNRRNALRKLIHAHGFLGCHCLAGVKAAGVVATCRNQEHRAAH